MTFLELEKLCKQRKRNKILKIILLIALLFSIIGGLYFFVNKNKVNTIKKQDINITKPIVKQKIKLEKKEKNLTQTKPTEIKIRKTEILKPIIDLNITINTKKEIKEQKKIKNKEIKTEKQNRLITTQVLPSYETCIKFAKLEYKQGNYKEALNWAKNANLQNKKLPDSWIITAKSLWKLNKKQKAIEILNIYYQYTKNKSIKKLIEEYNAKIH